MNRTVATTIIAIAIVFALAAFAIVSVIRGNAISIETLAAAIGSLVAGGLLVYRKNAAPLLAGGLILTAMVVQGCANPTTATLDAQGVQTVSQAANTARYTDQEWQANYQGVTPTQAVISFSQGLDVQTGGQGTAMALNGIGSIWSPKNVVMRGVELQPGPDGVAVFKADEISTDLSTVIAAYDAQVQAAVTAMVDMTRAEAERYVESLASAGKITESMAQVLLQHFAPRP